VPNNLRGFCRSQALRSYRYGDIDFTIDFNIDFNDV
jgi:hypothetical protein